MGTMRIALLHLKRMIKKPRVIIAMIIAPTLVVSIVAFCTGGAGSSGSDSINVGIANEDKGSYGDKLIGELNKEKGMSIWKAGIEESKRNVSLGRVAAVVVIPEDFSRNLENGEKPVVTIMKLPDSNISITIQKKVNDFIGENLVANSAYKMVRNKIQVSLNRKNILVKKEEVIKQGTKALSGQISVGVIVGFLMYSMLHIISEICDMRRDKTLIRSFSTPNKNSKILGAILLSMVVLFYAEIILLVCVTRFVFKIYWGNSILSLFLIFTAFMFVILSLGILISRFVKNHGQASAIVNVVVGPTLVLGGCILPISYLPKPVQNLSYFIPEKWVISALSDVALKNKGAIDILPQVGILLLFALVFFLAGSKLLREIVKE